MTRGLRRSCPGAIKWGMATAAIPITFQVTSNGRIGDVWTAYLSPRNARSDMAVSRQMTTPSITGRDRASCPHGDRFYGAVLSPSPRAVVARARYLAMLVAIDQITSARMPGRKP